MAKQLFFSYMLTQFVPEVAKSRNTEPSTEDPRYDDSGCYQRFCSKIEFAVIKYLK